MKVILNADIGSLGRKGDIVDVAAGYARNFLLPRKLAIDATKGARRQAESMTKAREGRERKERESFETLAARIASETISISSRAGDEGHLFGSVTNADIARRLADALGDGMDISRRKVEIDAPIRNVGTHNYKVHLHPDVVAEGTVVVVAESEEG